MSKELPTSAELLKKANRHNKPKPSLLDVYRDSIVLLKDKGFTYKEIETFLKDNLIIIPSYKISAYLKKINAAVGKNNIAQKGEV